MLTTEGEQSLSETGGVEQQHIIKARLLHCFRQMQDKPDMCRLYDMLLAYYMENMGEREMIDKPGVSADDGGNE